MYIYVHIYVYVYVIINVIIQGQLSYLTSLLDHVPDPTRTPCGTYTRTYIRTYYLILKGNPTTYPPPIYPTTTTHPTRPTRTYRYRYIWTATRKSDESTLPRRNWDRGRRDKDKPKKQGAVREDLGGQGEVKRCRKRQENVPAPTFNTFQIFYFLKY